MARILVIDDDASLLQMMSLMLKRAGHEPLLAPDGEAGIALAHSKQPDMAIVDLMMPDLSGYDVCRLLREDASTAHMPLLVLTALSQADQRELAEESGADDFITKPVTRDNLVNHVDDLLRTGPRNMPVPDDMAPARAQAAPAAPLTGAAADSWTGPLTRPYTGPVIARQAVSLLPLIAVIGLADGAGATTLAVNLGQGIAQSKRTCIVDLNPQSGQVAVQFRMIPPRATWHDLVGIEPGADKRQIGAALMMDRASGVAILAAPLQPTDERLTPEGLAYILRVLSEGFPLIVADLPPVLSQMTVTTLAHAEHIVIVIGDDPARLVAVPEVLANIEQLGLSGEVHLVLNHTRPHGLSFDEVRQSLGRPVAVNIPYEPAQIQALAQGTPLVISHPSSLFTQALEQLAERF
jgi:CheY-like chemotaxis protein